MNESPVEKLISESDTPSSALLDMIQDLKEATLIDSESAAKEQIILAVKWLNEKRGVKISDIHVSYNVEEGKDMVANFTFQR